MNPHLAIDLGASSGRVFLGELRSGILGIREIHRFPNDAAENGLSTHWDVGLLWRETRRALADVSDRKLAGIGVDAWGVDYALLDERGELFQNPYHYRDARNLSAMDEVLRQIPKEEIYHRTGIQFMPINTLNQLFAAKRDTPELLSRSRRLLMIPDLFHYWLCGQAVSEFTAASTTQFTNPVTRTWAKDLLDRLELPSHLLAELVEPGTEIGKLMPEVAGPVLAGTPIITPASHDTASAVAAVAARGNTAFLSSGTWSLIGTELDAPILSERALRLNFTNEGGIAGTTRLLKNVMGLWMLQRCRSAWLAQGQNYEFAALVESARGKNGTAADPSTDPLVDPDDTAFLNPPDMLKAIDRFCMKTDQPLPQGPGGYTRTVLRSLAFKYRSVILDLESIIGHSIDTIRVMGGGSQNTLLNQFTADATGKRIVAGPVEAAVLGNLGAQMLATGAIASIQEVRAIIDRSFPIEIFEPQSADLWNSHARRFQQYCKLNYAPKTYV